MASGGIWQQHGQKKRLTNLNLMSTRSRELMVDCGGRGETLSLLVFDVLLAFSPCYPRRRRRRGLICSKPRRKHLYASTRYINPLEIFANTNTNMLTDAATDVPGN